MVRVLIERRLRDATADQAACQRLQRELRGAVMYAQGYLTAETLRDVDDPAHWFVLSAWESRAAWDAWRAAPDRHALLERMQAHLAFEHVTVLEAV